jgi:hypothetical protein
MNSVMMKGAFLGMLGTMVLLVGCGGGGGGGSTFTPPAISNTPVAIDSTNQNQVANVAENGVSGAISGGLGAIGVAVEGGGQSFSAVDFVKKTVLSLGDAPLASGLTGPTGLTISGSCDLAPDGTTGTSSLTTNVADFATTFAFNAGDYATISSSNCYDSLDGTTVSGSVTLTMVSGTLDFNLADPLSGGLSIEISMTNLRSTDMGVTTTVHGDATLTASSSTSVSLAGNSLYMVESGGEAVHLTNFAISSTDYVSYTSTSVNATIASTALNGVVSISTDPSNPLLEATSASHPYAGTVIVTGGTTTLTMVVQDSTTVMLYLDADGVPGTDAGYPVTVTWTDIDNSTAIVL